jgi:hypothetical protein
VTYDLIGPAKLYSDPLVTYWSIKYENGIVATEQIAAYRYETPEFYYVQGVTEQGIFYGKERFMASGILFVCALFGGMIGVFAGIAVDRKIEKRRKRHRGMA